MRRRAGKRKKTIQKKNLIDIRRGLNPKEIRVNKRLCEVTLKTEGFVKSSNDFIPMPLLATS